MGINGEFNSVLTTLRCVEFVIRCYSDVGINGNLILGFGRVEAVRFRLKERDCPYKAEIPINFIVRNSAG